MQFININIFFTIVLVERILHTSPPFQLLLDPSLVISIYEGTKG